jgi:hypothetical protein
MRLIGSGSACQGLSGKIGMAPMSDSPFQLHERLAAAPYDPSEFQDISGGLLEAFR